MKTALKRRYGTYRTVWPDGASHAIIANYCRGRCSLTENSYLELEELDREPGHGGAARIAADCAKQGGPALKSAIPSETRPRVCSSSVSGLVKTSAGISFERTPKRVF